MERILEIIYNSNDIGDLYENLKNRLSQIDSEEFDKFGFLYIVKLLTGKPTQKEKFKIGKLLYRSSL